MEKKNCKHVKMTKNQANLHDHECHEFQFVKSKTKRASWSPARRAAQEASGPQMSYSVSKNRFRFLLCFLLHFVNVTRSQRPQRSRRSSSLKATWNSPAAAAAAARLATAEQKRHLGRQSASVSSRAAGVCERATEGGGGAGGKRKNRGEVERSNCSD